MRAHFLQYIFLFLLVHNSEFLENLIKNYCTRPHFDVVYSSAQWVKNCTNFTLLGLYYWDCFM